MSSITRNEIDVSEILHGASLQTLDPSEDFVTATLILDIHCKLGEGVIFDDRQSTVHWTDIIGKKFHSLKLDYKAPTKAVHVIYDLPKQLCAFGMLDVPQTQSDLVVLCAWEDGFQLYDVLNQKEISEYSKGEDVNPLKGDTRLNDGRVAPECKRFVCGGFYGDKPGNIMKVFKVEQASEGGITSLVHESILDKIEVTNSICWSTDGKTMYIADSPSHEIHSYKYCADSGKIEDKKTVHTKIEGVPDGSSIDSEGYIWNAVWKSGKAPSCVQRIDPESGTVVFTVHLPGATSQATCCCFGGEDLDILFITTACVDRDLTKEPHAGGLYAAKVPFKGCKERRLNFSI